MDPLLQPFTLKHLTLRNRLMSTSHEPAYSDDGLPKERYRLYHVEKAKGGIALTMTAGSAVVSRDSPPAFGNLLAFKDEIVPWMKALADECHDHGAAVMIQLTHLGRRTGAWNYNDWLPVLAPSPVREAAHRSFPKEIEDWDIDRIVGDYAAAAQRMEAAGLDGIEIEAYGHLTDQFWSPATNQRTDEYGGSLDNRLRFIMRVLSVVRAAVSPRFIVGVRMVADEDWEKGLTKEEGLQIAHKLVASGHVDFLNIIRGHMDTDAALTGVIPIMGMRSAPHLDFAGEIRSATKFPIFHAARITDVATARHAIAEGKLDMVGMTRPHIADPHIINKVKARQEHRIRPCVGATYCLDRIYEGKDALCIHNAATGREATMPHKIAKARKKKKVVIVGAGPAGLEAARVAAERGHQVIVFEALDKAGGQVTIASKSARRKELIGIVDWRLSELEQLKVQIEYSHYADENDVLGEEPSVVLIATGGVPNLTAVEGEDGLAVSSWDIVSGQVKPGENVLLYDDNGNHPGMTAAEIIAEAGSRLEIMTPERFFAPEMGGMNHAEYAKIFDKHAVRITINKRVRSVRRSGNGLVAVIASDYGNQLEERAIDQLVVENGTLPLDDLYKELKPLSINLGAVDYEELLAGKAQSLCPNPEGKFRLLRIGDAVASRNIHAAIYDGLRYAKDI